MDQTVELFCGDRKAFSCIAGSLGFSTFTVDKNPNVGPDLIGDVRFLEADELPVKPLVVWAAPPDAGFQKSHWSGSDPKDEFAKEAERIFGRAITLIAQMRPTWWFVENPKGLLRNLPMTAGFNRGYPSRIRQTIRHDEFGGEGEAETDIWTNAYWWLPRPGEGQGAQGNQPSRRVPPFVFAEIFEQLERYRRSAAETP